MGKWIRWQGVIGFAVVVGLLAAIWFLVVDRVVKTAIERGGTAVVGAKVELDDADVSLMPLGLTLTRLQVTNPDEPMTNAVEIARIAGTMDALNVFRRKVIVEELAVDGMRFNTPRKTSGAIAARPKTEEAPSKAGEMFALPSLQVNDPKAILDKELAQLESLKLVESIRTDIQSEQDAWKKRIAELPDKAKFEEYKKRFESLKSAGKGGIGGILGGVSEAQKLQEDIQRDLNKITGAKKELEQAVASLKNRITDVAKAPLRDVKRLMEKYSLSGAGVANLTRAVFAGPLGDHVDTAFRWHRRLEPFLTRPTEKKAAVEVVKPVRGKGVDVRFKERAPLPDLLVRTARVSLEIPAGAIKGQVKNITPDQPILGAPMTFAFAGEKLQGLDSIKLDGAINRVNPDSPKDTADLRVAGYRLDNLGLGGEAAPVSLKQGLADLDLKALLSGPKVDAKLGSRVRQVQMVVGDKVASGPVGEAIAGALADIKAFSLDATIAGTQEQYDLQLASDIDQVLKKALGKQVQAQAAKLEGQLRTAIQEKVNAQLGELKGNLGGFDALLQELATRANLGQEALHAGAAGAIGGKSGGGFKLPF